MAADPLQQALRRCALRCLAQREQSRSELQARLLRYAARPKPGRAGGEAGPGAAPEAAAEDDDDALQARRAAVELVLGKLEAQGLLSDQRFLEARVHARQAHWGSRRIAHELKQHGLALGSGLSENLASTELSRARALWRQRFAALPCDSKARLRQMRFLAARGFSGAVIRQVLQGEPGGDDDSAPDGG